MLSLSPCPLVLVPLWPRQTLPAALQQDINSGGFGLGDFKAVLKHMEMILRATAIKIIILPGERVT